MLGGRAHREFVHVRLPEHDGARLLQLRHHGGVVGRNEPVEDLRPARGADAARTEHVLDRERRAVERPARDALAISLVGGVRLGQRLFARDGEIAPDLVVVSGDPGKPGDVLDVLVADHQSISSRCAYWSDSRFRPTLAKRTVTIVSPPSFSMPTTIPSPQRACRTRAPTRNGRSSPSGSPKVGSGSHTTPPRGSGRALSDVRCSSGISRRKRDGSPTPYPWTRRCSAYVR